jgi:tripartite ATP-independent transporter DctM subunit
VIAGIIGTFALFLIMSVPVAFAIGAAAMIGLIVQGTTPLTIMASRVFGGIDSFTLLAIPFFIMAGDLLDTGGIARRLINLAHALVGHIRGGLGMNVVVGEIFFSGISGSTTADTAAIGSVMIPSMVERGYTPEQAAAIVCAASGMGILVPPCLTMVIYGSLTNTSIAALFAAGFLPAFVMAAALMVQIYIEARRAGFAAERRASLRELLQALREASWALLMPVIIFGGILGGAFTPTEAAVVAAAYGLIVGMFIYREISWADVWRIVVRTGTVTGTVMLLMATASILGWLLTILQLPQTAIDVIQALGGGKVMFLVISLTLFLGLFAVLDGLPAMVMVIPVFLPVAQRLGVDPLHFGILLTAVMGIALFMPPVGVALYVAADIAHTSAARIGRVLAPYLLTMFAVTLAIAFAPEIVYVVPRLLGFHVPP